VNLKIDHIAIKVADIDAVGRAFEELGYTRQETERYEEVAMDISFLGRGSGKLELLQPLDSSSPISQDPDGLHHVAVCVEDIDTTHARMSESSRFTVEGPLRRGAHSRIFFFRIVGGEDTLYECVETETETETGKVYV